MNSNTATEQNIARFEQFVNSKPVVAAAKVAAIAARTAMLIWFFYCHKRVFHSTTITADFLLAENNFFSFTFVAFVFNLLAVYINCNRSWEHIESVVMISFMSWIFFCSSGFGNSVSFGIWEVLNNYDFYFLFGSLRFYYCLSIVFHAVSAAHSFNRSIIELAKLLFAPASSTLSDSTFADAAASSADRVALFVAKLKAEREVGRAEALAEAVALAEKGRNYDVSCPICWCEDKQLYQLSGCQHQFCKECIDQCLEANCTNCALCRAPFTGHKSI